MERRTVLKAAGIGLALPMLEAFAAASRGREETRPRRFVAIGAFLGFHTPAFFPRTAGPDWESTTLLDPLREHRADLTVLSGLDHNGPNGHNYWGTYLTGPNKSDISLDQLLLPHLGGDTRFASLELSAGPPGAGMVMSVTKEGIALPMVHHNTVIYSRLFGRGADDAHLAYTLDTGRSVLDFVREDARRLELSLGAADRDKLDEYFTSLRDVEGKLANERAWLGRPKPQVDYDPPTEDFLGPDQEFEAEEVMYDLMALALATDSTRVISFFLPGLAPLFTIDGRRLVAGYHGLSHHNHDPQKIRDLLLIEGVHMRLFARFLAALKDKRDERGEPVLDDTLILFGAGMGDASRHSNQNLPILVAGGGLRHGRHLDFRAQNGESPGAGPVLANLYVTLARRLGVEVDSFANSNGDLDELLP
jgi:hypothetical protein